MSEAEVAEDYMEDIGADHGRCVRLRLLADGGDANAQPAKTTCSSAASQSGHI
jgi:hypothetical protein